jgi:hypothetical protein
LLRITSEQRKPRTGIVIQMRKFRTVSRVGREQVVHLRVVV